MSATQDWPRIKHLFQLALDQPEAQRRDFVRSRAQVDVALRDAVLKMLDHDEAPAGALDRGAREFAPSEAPTLPTSVGLYKTERVLGRGGMGVVLLATRQGDGFTQQVAIKLIRGGAFDSDLIARFRREREILARLTHPHIARLTDGGITDDGLPWYAMEYIEGEPLVTWCDARALSLRDRVRLFQQVLQAVDYAHRNLVVHRDLKPSNILVTAGGEVKLLDFGIAKLLDEAEGSALTGSDTRLMTPDYAAPEQILGHPIGTGADVYALGVLLFELLCGRLPYGNVGSGPRVAAAIVDREPERLRAAISRRTEGSDARSHPIEELARRRGTGVSRLRAALDRDLEQIVAIALAKRPEDRYASAAAMGEDLRAWLEARPLLSRPVPWPRLAAKFVRRHRFGVGASLALALVAFVGVFATVDQAKKARHEADTAQAVRRTLTEVLAAADPADNGGVPPTLREVLDLGVERIERDQALPATVRTPLLSDLGAVYAGLGEYQRASEVYEHAAAAGPDGSADAVERARLQMRLAESETELSQFETAEAALARARERLASASEPDPALSVHIELAAARIEEGRDQPQQAVARLRELIERLKTAKPTQPRELAFSLAALGSTELALGHSRESVALMRQALEQQRLAGASALDVAGTQVELARALRVDTQYVPAEAMMGEALQVQKQLLGEAHPVTLLSRVEHAIALQALMRFEEAEREFGATIDAVRQRFGDTHPRLASAANNFGVFLYTARRFDEAAVQFELAYTIWRDRLGGEHERTLQARGNLAGAWTEMGRVEDAREALETLVAVRRERGDMARLHSALLTRGLLYERVGRANDARSDYADALAVGRKLWPDAQAQWVWAQVLLGRALRRAGDLEQAEDLLDAAARHYQEPSYQGGGPRASTAFLELARTLDQRGRDPQRQLELARRSVEIRREKLGESHADTLEALTELDRLMARDGTPATAAAGR